MNWSPSAAMPPNAETLSAFLPRVFQARLEAWMPYLHVIDTSSSHPDTWDFLCELVRGLQARVIVEAGTYRGHATFAMAESLRRDEQEGHIWTADVEDFAVQEVLDAMGLADRVTFVHGRFEEMLATVPKPIDLAFIDASEPDNARYRVECLQHIWPHMASLGIVVMDDCAKDEWPHASELRARSSLYLPTNHGLCLFQKP